MFVYEKYAFNIMETLYLKKILNSLQKFYRNGGSFMGSYSPFEGDFFSFEFFKSNCLYIHMYINFHNVKHFV